MYLWCPSDLLNYSLRQVMVMEILEVIVHFCIRVEKVVLVSKWEKQKWAWPGCVPISLNIPETRWFPWFFSSFPFSSILSHNINSWLVLLILDTSRRIDNLSQKSCLTGNFDMIYHNAITMNSNIVRWALPFPCMAFWKEEDCTFLDIISYTGY